MIIFSPEGMYPPAGMFTFPHLFSLFICLIIIIFSIYQSRKISEKQLKKATLFIAIFATICEVIKISYKFLVCHYTFTDFDHWMPLYFCSIFIFACWFSLSKNSFIKNMGIGFLTCGTFSAGLSFLIIPTTSLQIVPIWHFLSFHSLTFHSLMVYLGFMYILKGFYNKNSFKYFAFCLLIFLIPSLIINLIFDSNLMLISKPYQISINFINEIYNKLPYLYPLIVGLVYLLIPTTVSTCLNFIIKKQQQNYKYRFAKNHRKGC